MKTSHSGLLRLCCLFAVCVFFGSAASADTIYLKNGRVIHCERTRVEGEHLVFSQYGGEVKIPLEAVERVETDSAVEAAPVPTLSQEEYRAELVRRYAEAGLSSPVRGSPDSTGGGGDVVREGTVAPVAAAPGNPKDWRELSPDTRQYWQLRMAEVHQQIARVEAEIDRLPEYNHLEEKILDGRILWVVQRKEQLEARVRELRSDLSVVREDARKSGIPPGWLRLPAGERRR